MKYIKIYSVSPYEVQFYIMFKDGRGYDETWESTSPYIIDKFVNMVERYSAYGKAYALLRKSAKKTYSSRMSRKLF